MRRTLLVLLITFLCINVYGQDTVKRMRTSTVRQRLDTNTIVYDEQGNGLRYYQYQKILNTGDYIIYYDGGAPFKGKPTLKRLTQQQKNRSYQMVSDRMAINSPALQKGKELNITPLLDAVSKDDLERKVIVMIFWYPDCPPCTESFASLNDFLKQVHNPQDLIILAITSHSDMEAAYKLKQKPLKYATLISNAGSIIDQYGVRSFPSYVVTDRNHIIHLAVSGLGTSTLPVFEDMIREVLIQ
jgi:peroxiredoxin